MTEFGICHLPLAPLRSHPDDASEMVSQLLFGQSFDILETAEKWTLIRNHNDGYRAYIGNKQFVPISKEQLEAFNSNRKIVDNLFYLFIFFIYRSITI